jgi:hypothetical protein
MGRSRSDRVKLIQDRSTTLTMSYGAVAKRVDEGHMYDLFHTAEGDRSGMNSGTDENLSREELLGKVDALAK